MKKALLLSTIAVLLLAGCKMRVSKTEAGEDKNVTIKTPLGGVHVSSDDVEAKDTGLPEYPGARIRLKDDEEKERANVNINTPWFGLKVVALSYESSDSPEKVWNFYKKEMARYGRVLECKPGSPDMKLEKNDKDDLTCRDDDNHHGRTIQIGDHSESLKVGSKSRQRIVEVEPHGKGTKFAIVYLVTRDKSEAI